MLPQFIPRVDHGRSRPFKQRLHLIICSHPVGQHVFRRYSVGIHGRCRRDQQVYELGVGKILMYSVYSRSYPLLQSFHVIVIHNGNALGIHKGFFEEELGILSGYDSPAVIGHPCSRGSLPFRLAYRASVVPHSFEMHGDLVKLRYPESKNERVPPHRRGYGLSAGLSRDHCP